MDRSLKNCNAIKAVLMLCVVLYHSVLILAGGGWGPIEPANTFAFFKYLSKWLGTFHIYGFTMVSGYIYYFMRIEKGCYDHYGSFLKKKAYRLLVPYLFIALVWVMPVHIYFYGTEGLLHKFLLGINPSQLWFC